ncbi:MAG: tetraacyldisaccharide 4'-kinase [Desulfobacterales bacterium]|nr:tetraacyldisaccharide 4'-kinase [Desulfobacterales bacterium]
MNTVNWSAIHAKRQRNVITFFLRPISLVYSLAIRLRLIAYEVGLFSIKSLPTYVVSIGNITTGGTGKTPFVAMLAEWASRNGFRVGILSRGYKRKRSRNTLVVSDGKKVLASVAEAGDEPFLLAKKLPTVPVLVSKKRCRIGHLALSLFNSELLLLDDGYQHLSLKRDLDILLLDAKRQFGNRSLLPLGPLREPVEQAKRADLIIITRCTDEHPGDDLVDFLQRNFPGRPIFRSGHFPDQVMFPLVGKTYSPGFLSGKKVLAFAGLANPDNFLEMVKGLGAHVIHFKAFSDHHPFTKDEIEELASWKRRSDADFLLTTEKDWVRTDSKIGADLDVAILTIKTGLLSGRDIFFDIIRQGIIKSTKTFSH